MLGLHDKYCVMCIKRSTFICYNTKYSAVHYKSNARTKLQLNYSTTSQNRNRDTEAYL